MKSWTLEDSKLVYGIAKNDMYFLDINDKGELTLKIEKHSIPLKEIIQHIGKTLKNDNYTRVPSFILRIPQLFKSQIEKLTKTFDAIIKEKDYKGKFLGFYPIKANPTKRVISSVINYSSDYSFEVGSKTEFVLVLEALSDQKHRTIMCDGVKDHEYISLIKQALMNGYKIIISIESLSELKNVIENIPPAYLNLALRIKPYVKVKGHWSRSTGRDSKFGLSIDQYREVIKEITKNGLFDKVIALHSHPGSQLIDVDGLEAYITFLAERYNELHSLGFREVKNIDIGGGFPVNYDNRLPANIVELFVRTIINTLKSKINTQYSQPNIIVEAGRYITAPSSMVIVQTLDIQSIFPSPKTEYEEMNNIKEIDQMKKITKLLHIFKKTNITINNLDSEKIEDKEQLLGIIKKKIRKRIMELTLNNVDRKNFVESLLSLSPQIFSQIYSPDYLLLGNFSVFKTVCDWLLVNQYFPIMPIEHLNSQPETLIRLIDITCDSDGEISIYHPTFSKDQLFTKDGFPLTLKNKRFDLNGTPIGKIDAMRDSYLVIALTGAYQDVVEFNHNLLGDLPNVYVKVEDNNWSISWHEPQQSSSQLIHTVGYDIQKDVNAYISFKK